jgi:hypothetical protein
MPFTAAKVGRLSIGKLGFRSVYGAADGLQSAGEKLLSGGCML